MVFNDALQLIVQIKESTKTLTSMFNYNLKFKVH